MNFSVLFGLLVILSIIQNGIWYSPQTERLLLVSQNIFRNPFNEQVTNQWLLYSFLGPIIGYLTHLNSSLITYSLLHFAVFLLLFGVFLIVVRYRMGDFAARIIMIAFFLTPLPNIVFTWLGSPDVFTILLAGTIVVFSSNPACLFPTYFLMGINHFEQGSIILALTTIFMGITRERERERERENAYVHWGWNRWHAFRESCS
jgi:hypothetical protein